MALDRGLVRSVLVVLALGCGVALLWAAGAFQPALQVGRPTVPGEPVDLQRWTVRVDSCELVDRSLSGYDIDPTVRILTSVVNRTDQTIQTPEDGWLTARVAGADLDAPRWAPGQLRSSLNFDPDVAVAGAYDFDLLTAADPTQPVTVLVHRERNRPNLIFRDLWVSEEPAAAVTMTCPDRREGDAVSRRLVDRGAVVSLLACLVAVALISLATPVFGAESRYRYTRVALGEWGALREFDARAEAVRLAEEIDLYSEALRTEHRFVVVTLEAAVRTRSQSLANLELRTRDGRRYEPRPEWFSAGPPGTQPGFSSRGMVVFEVPADRVPGAQLFVGSMRGEVTRYDAALLVDLGLTGTSPVESTSVSLPAAQLWVTR